MIPGVINIEIHGRNNPYTGITVPKWQHHLAGYCYLYELD